MLPLAAALILSACGGSDDDKGVSPTSTVTAATGAPIKLVSIEDELTREHYSAGIRTAVDYINNHGGVKGRPLQVTICPNNDDANVAASCARKAIADGVVADVASANNFGSNSNPVYEAAGVSVFGDSPLTSADFTSKAVFPLQGGSISSVGGQVALSIDVLKAKRVAVAYLNVAAGETLPPLLDNAVLKPRGLSLVAKVAVPRTVTDVAPQVANLLRANPDAVVVALTTDLASKFIRAVRQAGYKGTVTLPSPVYSESLVKSQLSGATDNLYLVGFANHAAPAYADFVEQMKAAGRDDFIDDAAAMAWMGVNAFAKIAASMPDITREAFTKLLPTLTAVDTGGITPSVDLSKPGTALGGQLPRLFNTTTFASVVKDGKIVAFDKSGKLAPFAAPQGG
ncbi:hypothetical protein BL253_34510 [Pseudofrankia asymbiotica]|uniref:Leucine-binding protein domain-containing protein n=1 Tax=Pseudofrankia asymbiotica TaxID=1834516 RepID=A0A1V2I0K8_9ACTN|nr:hypothetical protein BL253_34510 [Pseudofrankia asymbiotica]